MVLGTAVTCSRHIHDQQNLWDSPVHGVDRQARGADEETMLRRA